MELEMVEFTYVHPGRPNRPVKIRATFNEDGTWHQWGATTPELGENVALMEAIGAAIREIGIEAGEKADI